MESNLSALSNELSNTSSNGTGGNQVENYETEGCRLFRFLLYSVICGVLCFLGFAGNFMSFLVLQKDKSTPVASFLLQVLAVADNLFLLLWFIHYSVKDVFRYFRIQPQPSWMYVRVYTFPLMYMTQMETIWLTVVVAMNRYMAVCLPYRAPSLCTIHNVYKEVVFATIFSVLYNIPRFLELRVTSNSTVTRWERTSIGHDMVFKNLYIDAMYYLFTFVIPLLILAFVNTRVIIAYRATQKRKRRMTSRRADNENNITLVMIIVVLIFMICQAPARLVQMIWSYRYNHCEEFQYYLIHISNSLEVLNSSVNFLVYFTFRKRFRNILGEYYCTQGPLKFARDGQKSLTTEGLALREYPATTAILDTDINPPDIPKANEKTDDKTTEPLKTDHEVSKGLSNGCLNNSDDAEHCTDNAIQTDLIDYELSSENPMSITSSLDNYGANDNHVLFASV